ncbi:hypothetical protein CLV78_101581 [Aliiruegeria haliotis]|uniref:Uncharacterized protein n=1 Tax=Aliiruegeria haliotis TaxID=1280846 RepID=A0A2T0RZ81_9RHOB|nr:hypothetical protein CLV78_101581 [Aliiruegeria haliotis]
MRALSAGGEVAAVGKATAGQGRGSRPFWPRVAGQKALGRARVPRAPAAGWCGEGNAAGR